MSTSGSHGEVVHLTHGEASADVAVYGSTVISWHPAASKDKSAIFLSKDTKPGKPFRGGIPLVFPVFGEPKDHKDLPELMKKCTRHGFCRDRQWKIKSKDTSRVSMVLSSDNEPALLEKYPFAFSLTHTVTLTDESLESELYLEHLNSSQHDDMPFHALFHNYLAVPSGSAKASGLKGTGYIDKVAGGKRVTTNDDEEQGWSQEIDRVYQGGAPKLVIDANDGSDTQLILERSKTLPDTTIWNPGQGADESMGDLHQGGWKEFVCAEPGHVDSFERLAKGKTWTGTQKWSFRKGSSQKYDEESHKKSSSQTVDGDVAAGAAAGAVALGGAGAAAASSEKKESSKDDAKGGQEGASDKESKAAKDSSKDSADPLHKTISEHYSSKGKEKNPDEAAARLIQRNYRSYVSKREQDGMTMSPDARWGDAMGQMKLQSATTAARSGKANDAESRWKRGGVLVGQLAGSPSTQTGSGGKPAKMIGAVEGGPSLHLHEESQQEEKEEEKQDQGEGDRDLKKSDSDNMVGDVPGGNEGDKVDNIRSIADKNQHGLKIIEKWTRGAPAQELSKVMEAQYWLEMVDRKHRYGSNLKHYHAAWQKDDKHSENFFKWLDEGAGKDLDLQECPRERLESEQIVYLSAEQRSNYVIDVKEGRLYWRRNGKPVDTTKNRWRDLGHGRGIVELGPEEKAEIQRQKEERAARRGKSIKGDDSSSSSSSSSSESSSDEDSEDEHESKKEAAAHYGGDKKDSSVKSKVTTQGLWDRVLRKTISNNTWIYVFNSRYELFIGIKKTGNFQHSSFLYGGRVLSAGLLTAKDGYLTSLSPLSGHYRAGTAHFRYFVASLQDSGVNLDHVTLSKSLLMLRGLEVYGKMNKKLKGASKKKKGDDEKQGKEQGDKKGSDEHKNKGDHTKESSSLVASLRRGLKLDSHSPASTAQQSGEAAA